MFPETVTPQYVNGIPQGPLSAAERIRHKRGQRQMHASKIPRKQMVRIKQDVAVKDQRLSGEGPAIGPPIRPWMGSVGLRDHFFIE